MDVQLRYRGKGYNEKKFDKNDLHCILPQALNQSFGLGNHQGVSSLPKLFDVKSYGPYTCRDIRKYCLPDHIHYEYTLSEKSFSRREFINNLQCFRDSSEDFQITIFAKKDLSTLSERVEREKEFFKNDHRKSFLPRTFGLYSYKEHKKQKIYFSVTNNVLPNNIIITERYTLKGYPKRKADSKNPKILKDADFDKKYARRLTISREDFDELYKILKNDCQFLSDNNWINYYLFVAVHEVNGKETNTEYQIGTDTVDEHTLKKESIGLLGQRSLGIKATTPENKTLLLFIGIMGNFQQYSGIRESGHRVLDFFNVESLWTSPSRYKDRLLKQFKDAWFKFQVENFTRL